MSTVRGDSKLVTAAQTEAKPSKVKTKVTHMTIGSRVDAAIASDATEVLALCGRFNIQVKNLAPSQYGKAGPKRRCKTCVKALEANWRRHEDFVIREMEKQFAGGRHE